MLVGVNSKGQSVKIGAELLCDSELESQYESHFDWLMKEPDSVVGSKFSLDMAWFKECWWEMVRRNLVTVN